MLFNSVSTSSLKLSWFMDLSFRYVTLSALISCPSLTANVVCTKQ